MKIPDEQGVKMTCLDVKDAGVKEKKRNCGCKKKIRDMNERKDMLDELVSMVPKKESLTTKSTVKFVNEKREDSTWSSLASQAKSRKKYGNKTVKDWNKKDLLSYYRDRVFSEYRSSLKLAPAMGMSLMTALDDSLSQALGRDAKPTDIKAYINFFVDRILPRLLSNGSYFWNSIERFENISQFALSGFPGIEEDNSLQSEENSSNKLVNAKDIESAKKLGAVYLAEEYGWIAVNQFMGDEKLREVYKKVKTDKSKLECIKEATEKYSPYPEEFFDKVIQKLISHLGINIEKGQGPFSNF